ncbi:MAG: MOSC domain-containing protein [Anaerolineae bacterium]|jgi:hypothetical protein|nr:MOSC domain-containing protein [Anaerolineae bacterium]
MLTLDQLTAQWAQFDPSPYDQGRLELIVARPQLTERHCLNQAQLDLHDGLIGDNWRVRGSRHTPDGSANPDQQITLMNSRVIQLLSGDRERWALAGDQLFVDFDLSETHLPAGTLIQIGEAILMITAKPHTGCKKFSERFGVDALQFISTPEGRAKRLRGVNARVIQNGTIRIGDSVIKLPASDASALSV